MRFLLTIDTEGDNQWVYSDKVTVNNLRYLPRFQDLCNKHKIKPTYVVTSEVCEDDYAKELFRSYLKMDVAEIGTHLHIWTTPPFYDVDGFRYNDRFKGFA